MKRMIHATLPKEFMAHPAYIRAVMLGIVYLFLAVMQLFSFEKYFTTTSQFLLPGDAITAAFVAGLIPTLEIAALPFLLSMKVSDLTREISKYAAIAAPALWLVIAIWLVITADMSVDSGLLGATTGVPSGWWLVGFSGLLLAAVILIVRELPKRR